ncbi:MAG: DUF1127 domain-containing protein [Thiofilum sp.]|uniref:DUF1127 domain-containing protein n=1 Tax=Thiofilum sp. TaxID=2212733 RepID=UPI0025E9D125|nr:DUF1127 domain-containing protein [Thiofilum sp.]
MKTLSLTKVVCNRQEQRAKEPKTTMRLLIDQVAKRFWQLFSITWYTLIHWRKLRLRQQTRAQLLDLTNEQLRDIGLTRYEVECEARKWFWE